MNDLVVSDGPVVAEVRWKIERHEKWCGWELFEVPTLPSDFSINQSWYVRDILRFKTRIEMRVVVQRLADRTWADLERRMGPVFNAEEWLEDQRARGYVGPAVTGIRWGDGSLTMSDFMQRMQAGVDEMATRIGKGMFPAVEFLSSNVTTFWERHQIAWEQRQRVMYEWEPGDEEYLGKWSAEGNAEGHVADDDGV